MKPQEKTQEEIKEIVDNIKQHALTQFGTTIENDVISYRVKELIKQLTDSLIDNRIHHLNLQDACNILIYLEAPSAQGFDPIMAFPTVKIIEKRIGEIENGRPTDNAQESNDPVHGQGRKANRPRKAKAPSSTL